MSSTYRDDNTDGAAARDNSWGGFIVLAEEAVSVAGVLLFGLLVAHDGGAAVASDSLSDAVLSLFAETATAASSVPSHLVAANLVEEQGRARDKALPALRVMHEDHAVMMGAIAYSTTLQTSTDSAVAADAVLAQRKMASALADQATLADSAWQAAKTMVADTALATDASLTAASTSHGLGDSFQATDAATGMLRAREPLWDGARGTSSVSQHLAARDFVQDWMDAGDSGMQPRRAVAWTANTTNWAMSRYEPFNFTSLAVINGVLCATGEDGVYALDGEDETITAMLTTGQMDVGQGQLAHLTDAYLAYELDGSASMTVSQTQGGSKVAYTYQLPDKPADTLTTGRFQLGRGLRGRHFAFSLQLTGKAGYINDLRVSALPVKRRV
jgi:hypothetical protein